MENRQLETFDIRQAPLLGEGGEAQIYGLDNAQVLRLFREGAPSHVVAARTGLLAEIAAGSTHLSFETPQVIEQGVFDGRIYTIEKRIPGTSLLTALATAKGECRRRLIEQYMDTAWELGRINIQRPFFGEISRRDAVQTATWSAYLVQRARRSLNDSPFATVAAEPLAAAIGDIAGSPAFVHLDYFAGNVMAYEDEITAVIDFGYSSIIGDRRLNTLVAAAHLTTTHITPTATEEDRLIALSWLRERDLFSYYERGVPWLAAYWAFATDDVELFKWCSDQLGKR